MKKILITGANSYIGISLEKWLEKYPEEYYIDTVSTRNDEWKNKNFSEFDIVFHVAGIAHVSNYSKMENQYFEINRDLSINVFKKAKAEGIKQFIFMSSIIVYGDNNKNRRIIDRNVDPTPSTSYGKSKLQAEKGLNQLNDDNIKVVILRPPMIYGKGSKGNYPKLANLAKKIPVFPDINNERSMLHIDNLCEFIKLMIDYEENGLFFPQNKEYVKTSDLVRLIAEVHGKNIALIKFFNPILKLLQDKVGLINKVFGNLVYEKSMSVYDNGNYQIRGFKESIDLTELESGEDESTYC